MPNKEFKSQMLNKEEQEVGVIATAQSLERYCGIRGVTAT